jgi:hypothetical protein
MDPDELATAFDRADEALRAYAASGVSHDLRTACQTLCDTLERLDQDTRFWARMHEAVAAHDQAPKAFDTAFQAIDRFALLEDDLLAQGCQAAVARRVVLNVANAIDLLGGHPAALEIENLRVMIRELDDQICAAVADLAAAPPIAADHYWRDRFSTAGRFAIRGVRLLAGAVEAGYDVAAIAAGGALVPLHWVSISSGFEVMWSAVRPCRD